MKKVFIVTGTTRGLGKEIVKVLLKETDHQVVSLSRRLINEFSDIPDLVQFDIDLADTDAGMLFPDIISYLEADHVIIVNNAAMIEPIRTIGSLPEKEITTHVKVNMISPMILINRMVPYLKNGKVTFLNISSGVVNNVIAGWSLYCSTKSAMEAYFDTLSKEHTDWEIKSIDPGIMDTDMQESIRKGEFEEKERFESFRSEGKLDSPETVAKRILSGYL